MNQNEGAPGQADVDALPVSGSTTHDKPQEPMKGSELTVVQRSAIDIGELEREMKAAGKLTARGREMLNLMWKADSNGNSNGRLDAVEAMTLLQDAAEVRHTATQYPPPVSRTILTPCARLVHPRAQSRLNLKRLRLWLIIAMAFIVILLLGNGGLIAFVTAIYKDTYVKGDTTMSDANGKVVLTGKATHNLPLIVAPVLPEDELFSVETLRLTLPGSTSGPPELGSGEAINEVSPGVVTSLRMFRISSVEKINSTAVVFHALGGEEIRVWNGVTTVRLAATEPEIPVCSADVTCAAFQVEGAELAEKYLAEAEALLEPFAEGRRRLAKECENPLSLFFGSSSVLDQRGLMQMSAKDMCQPTTEAACRRLALKLGMPFGGSSVKAVYFGCYGLSGNGKAYFGGGGTETQKLQAPMERKPPYWTPTRLSSLDTDCLLLSNQAELQSNQAAILSKLDPALSYRTPTQECLVAKNGDQNCTEVFGEIPSYFARDTDTTLTGTLKVGRVVTSIGSNAFYDTDLTGLDLSEATALVTIGDQAFYDTALMGQEECTPNKCFTLM